MVGDFSARCRASKGTTKKKRKGSAHGDALDLNARTFRERFHRHRGAGGEGGFEERGVDLVHGGEVFDVGQEDGGFHHMVERQTGFGQHVGEIGERAVGEFSDAAGHKLAGGGIDRQLSADVDGAIPLEMSCSVE